MRSKLFLIISLCTGCGGSQADATTPNRGDDTASADAAGGAGSGETSAPQAMQPKWTMIDGVRDCTGTILSSYVCTPEERPAACSEKAWAELTALSGSDALTPCALEPDLMDCTVAIPDDETGRCFPSEHAATCTDEKWARVKDVKLVYPCQQN